MAMSDKMHPTDTATISLACAVCGQLVPAGKSHECGNRRVVGVDVDYRGDSENGKEKTATRD